MMRLALLACLALTACAGHPLSEITPGLTLKCDGRCRIIPANLHHTPDPAALQRPNREASR